MKKILCLFTAITIIVSSMACVLSTLASQFKTFNIDFQDSTKAIQYITGGTQARSNHASVVTEAQNSCLKFEFITGQTEDVTKATFALPNTTGDSYTVLFPNNNGNGKVKISFKYKVEKAVMDGSLYVCRVNDDSTSGLVQSKNLDPTTLTNSVKVAEITNNTTTDWVSVSDAIITTKKDTAIYLCLMGIRKSQQNSIVYIDDIVVEETNDTSYTVNVDGINKTILGVAGEEIDLSKMTASKSKTVVGIYDKDGNPVTVFPTDANAELFAKTALINDFSSETDTEKLLKNSTTNSPNSTSSTYYADGENGTAKMRYISGNHPNALIYAFAIGDYSSTNPVPYKPYSGQSGMVKISFKYKALSMPRDADIYVFRKESGSFTSAGDWNNAAGKLFNNQDTPNKNFSNNGLISKKVASISKNTTSADWESVTCYFTSGEDTAIYIGVQTGEFKSLKVDSVITEILIDDIIVEENISVPYTVDVNGVSQNIFANVGDDIDLTEICTPYAKYITDFKDEAGNLITKYPSDYTNMIYAVLENEDDIVQFNDNLNDIVKSENVELSNDYDANSISSGKSIKYTLNDTAIEKSLYTNSNGSPIYVENGAKYDLVYKVYCPDSVNQNIELSASFLSASVVNGASQELQYKVEKSENINVKTNEWVEVTQTVEIASVNGEKHSAVGVGLSGANGTIAYVDNIKVVAYLKEGTSVFVDFNDSEKASAFLKDGNNTRSKGGIYGEETANSNGYVQLSERGNSINRVYTFSIPDFSRGNFIQYIPTKGVISVSFKYKVVNAPVEASIYVMRKESGIIANGTYVVSSTVSTLTSQYKKVASYGEKETTDWIEVNNVYFDSNGDTPIYIAISNEDGKLLSTEDAKTEVWIDDVKITTILNTPNVEFDTMGGNLLDNKAVIPNENVGLLPSPIKDGYVFDGWYSKDYTTYYGSKTQSPETGRAIKMYAKWTPIPNSAVSYSTSFEQDEYSVTPYANIKNSEKQPLSNMTENAVWDKDAGQLEMVNDPCVTEIGNYFQSASLMNSDGTRFMVLKGQRYKITYSYYSLTPTDAHSFCYAIVSDRIAEQGINATDDQVIDRQVFHGECEDWVTVTANFEPKETGFVYFAIAARKSDIRTGRYHNLFIDDVSITPIGNEFKQVVFMDGNTVLKETIGKANENIIIPGAPYKEGKVFSGWYSEPEAKNKVLITKYPDKDLVLYAGYEETAKDRGKDYYKMMTSNLEDTEAAQTFFTYNANMSHKSDATWPEIEFVTGDSKNARSGSNYLKFSRVFYHYEPVLLSFYDPDSANGQVTLKPGQEYKVSYWLSTLDDTSEIRFDVCLTEPASNTAVVEVVDSITLATVDWGYGNWIQQSHYVKNETDRPLVLTLRNTGSRNICMLDDFSVVQLKDVEIKFETNGGTSVDTLITKNYSIAEVPDDPIKEGYAFAGWFTDKQLTKPFNFETDEVISDMTLYAKWILENSDSEGESIGDVDSDVFEDTNIEDDINTGERPPLLDAEKVIKANQNNNDAGISVLAIVLLSVGAVILVAVITLVIIIFKRKKQLQI